AHVHIGEERRVQAVDRVAAVGDRDVVFRFVAILEVGPDVGNFGLDGRVEAAVDGGGAGGHVVEGENEINDVLVAGRVVPSQPALLDEDAHRVGAGVARKSGVAVPGPDPQVLLRDAD